VESALDVARALAGQIEMLEQPTPADDLEGLRQATISSPVPILADQSVAGPDSALQLAAKRAANGLSVKMATCGGIRCARQVDAIARAAQLVTMVGCVIEPALLIAAGLSFALSSSNVGYGDLDGHLDLVDDPTVAGFLVEDGWLVATDMPGLGCAVDI
jgi:L-alanine-DL-glutamate epimerase-like enolase superfamily enzyme